VNEELHELPGPLLLLAGPGTGKTSSLGKRIKFLVEEVNVLPENITVITFTAAAARNMRDKISDITKPDFFLPYNRQPMSIRTMHSLGYKIVRENASDIGLKEITSVVTGDNLRNILVGDAAQLAGYDRDDGKETAQCRQFGACQYSDEKKCHICNAYLQLLRSCSAIDYDEQILLACKLLREKSDTLAKYQAQCKHLLVDEYQDINAAQFDLISLLSQGQRDGLFVVGDDDQSIYSWRGGSPEFIRRFKEDFGKKARVERARKSFRCHKHILEGSISIVKDFDLQRLPKDVLEYQVEEGPKIQIHNAPSDEKEAVIVRSIVERALPSLDVLILFPHRRFASVVVRELRNAGIKFTAPMPLPGEGLPLISILSKWLKNNNDSLAFREILEEFIENPSTGIPSKKTRKPEKKRERKSILKKISSLWKHTIERRAPSLWVSLELERENDTLYSLIFSAFSDLISFYNKTQDPANFVSQVINTLAPWKHTQSFLDEVDTWVETLSERTSFGEGPNVHLMTFQGAKGLEAKVVCVIGLEDGILPRSESKEKELVEQSRLMFVSMTRAIEELHLFHARKRSGNLIFRSPYKKGKPPDIQRSRFLDHIPEEHREERYHPA
jgi:superfamily I DNA/RNA helicase